MIQFFKPSSIAVIGASRNEEKIGHVVVKNILEYGFKGRIYPINIKGGEILGLKAYKSILDVEDSVDLAIIAIPQKFVLQVLEECGRKGVKGVVVITSGFAEVGEKEAEKKLVETCKKYGMRMIGPNVFGLIYTPERLNATFGPRDIFPGKIGFATQSGALGVALLSKTIRKKIGLSAVVSLGNKADVDDTDVLDFLWKDENTKVIIFYIEGLKDGRKFIELAEKVVQDTPIVVLKSGRTREGARAAASHTGSLAGSDKVFGAAMKQSGALRAISVEEAFDWGGVLSTQKIPKGENVIIITNGGGPGVLASDAAVERGLHLMEDYQFLEKIFKKYLPPFASMRNPIDITGQGGIENAIQVFEEALKHQEIHAIVLIYTETAEGNLLEFAKGILKKFKNSKDKKPVVVCFIGGKSAEEGIDYLNSCGIPAYPEPERAISSLASLYNWKKERKRREKVEIDVEIDVEGIKKIVEKVRREKRLQILEHEAKEILRLAQFDVPNFKLGKNIDECKKIAHEIGYPVVLKIVSEDIIHKSDVGGVRVGIQNDEELEEAYKDIMRNVKKKYPRARIRGILVCEMVEEGTEVILGLTEDPSFGSVLMFGLGGIYVEVLKDVTFRVAPLSLEDAKEMISEVKASLLLYGARGQKKKDVKALAENIYKLGKLAEFVEIVEMDINPLMVLEKGCKVLDARMTLKPISHVGKSLT